MNIRHNRGAIADLPNYLYDEATPRVLATPRSTAYIKIAEGCDRPQDDVCNWVAAQGHRLARLFVVALR